MSCACEIIDTPGLVGHYDQFVIPADTDWTITLTSYEADGVTPLNYTGYTARAVLCSTGQTSIELTTANGGITLGGAAGTVTLDLTSAQTAGMAVTGYILGIDLINSAGKKERYLEGLATVTRDATPPV